MCEALGLQCRRFAVITGSSRCLDRYRRNRYLPHGDLGGGPHESCLSLNDDTAEQILSQPVEGYFVTFGDNTWAEIESEKIYGHTIPNDARDAIRLATLYLTFWLPRERNAPRLDGDTTKLMIELLNVATKIRSDLFPDYLWNTHSNLNKKDNIGRQLDKAHHDDDFGIFLVCLNGIVEIGNIILREIKTGEYGGLRDGDTWNTWIALITLILQANKLPTGIREGDAYRLDSQGNHPRPAPFVRLIKYLNKFAIEGDRNPLHGSACKSNPEGLERGKLF